MPYNPVGDRSPVKYNFDLESESKKPGKKPKEDGVISKVNKGVVKTPPVESRNLTGRVDAGGGVSSTDQKVKEQNPTKTVSDIWSLNEKYDGGLWRCIGVEKNPYGNTYIFREKSEFIDPENPGAAKKKIDKKEEEIFPAQEELGNFLHLKFNKDVTDEDFSKYRDDRIYEKLENKFDSIFDPKSKPNKSELDRIESFKKYLNNESFSSECFETLLEHKNDANFRSKWLPRARSELRKLQIPFEKKDAVDRLTGVTKFKLECQNQVKFFEALGFKSRKDPKGGHVLTLPDTQTVNARWGLMREKNPGLLPEIKFIEAKGGLTDEDFIKAYIDNNVIVGAPDSGFFLHDTTIHLVALISFILSFDEDKREKMYDKEKHRLSTLVNEQFKPIKTVMDRFEKDNNYKLDKNIPVSKMDVEVILMLLSSVVDSISAYQNLEGTSQLCQKDFDHLPRELNDNPNWIKYTETRFEGYVLDIDHLDEVWGLIRKLTRK